MKYQVICGDSLDKLKLLPANSVDSVVTDPPYELGFMGKGWDKSGIAYSVPLWTEVFRVLKPGGYLLAFGGTRTHHRMTCAIEDAGFEIRDELDWVYGQGFPKSLSVGCRCAVGTHPKTLKTLNTGDETPEHTLRPVRQTNVSSALATASSAGEVLFSTVPEQSVSAAGREKLRSGEARSGQSGVEGRSDVLPQTRKLRDNQVREVSGEVQGDVAQGRVRCGASLDCGAEHQALSNAGRSSSSHQPRPDGQSHRELGTVSQQPSTQTGRRSQGATCSACGGITTRKGWGTALKPGREPIVMARKPLEGTVADNILKYGTGAINIDATRIGENPGYKYAADRNGTTFHGQQGERIKQSAAKKGADTIESTQGRWPANFIHDGSEEVLAQFPHRQRNGRSQAYEQS